MKLVVNIERMNNYKHFGSVIEAGFKQGFEIELWLEQNMQPGNSKFYLKPKTDQVPVFQQGVPIIRTYKNKSELLYLIDAHQPDVLMNIIHPDVQVKETLGSGLNVVVQYSIDTALRSTPAQLEATDMLFTYSDFWIDWLAEYYSERDYVSDTWITTHIREKCVAAGFSQMDIMESVDHVAIRQKFNIPAARPVIVLLPLTLSFWSGFWPQFMAASSIIDRIKFFFRGVIQEGWDFLRRYWLWLLAGWDDQKLHRAIKRFSDANNAYLIAKGREKEPFRTAIEEHIDLGVYDNGFYPPTSLELFAIADLVIHPFSTAVLETAYLGVPSISILRPHQDILVHKKWRKNETGSAFNFPGVNQIMSIPEIIAKLPKENLRDFQLNKDRQREFLAQYTGPNNYEAGERILKAIIEKRQTRLSNE